MRRLVDTPWMGLLGLVTFVLAWHLAALGSDPWILPTPAETLTALVTLARSGALGRAALATTGNTLTGFALAVLIGGALGAAGGIWAPVRRFVGPVVTVLQGVPQIAWVVLAMFWFGISNDRSVLFTVAVAVLPIVFTSVVEGVRTVDRSLLAMARSFRTPPAMLARDVYFPHVLSYLFPAIFSGVGIAWKVAVMGELLLGGSGRTIGVGLLSARTHVDVPAAMAWVLLAVLLGFALEYVVLRPLRRWLEPWRHTDEGRA